MLSGAQTHGGGVKPYEREALLDRIERDGATVGVSIPEELEVGEEAIELRKKVFALHAAANDGRDVETAVDALQRKLRRVRTDHITQLQTDEIDRPTAEAIVDTVIGIDRARRSLQSIGDPTDIEESIAAQERADHKRWMTFLKRARGKRGGRR